MMNTRGRPEVMCCACHGPIEVLWPHRPTAIVCRGNGGNCMQMWRRMKRGESLCAKYEAIRAMHAYRRHLLAVQARLADLLHAGGWLEVGA